jgi:WhiB family redox-sensing transcriptional regulator
MTRPSFRDVYQTAEYIEGDTSWHAQAACSTADTAIFYPPSRGVGHNIDWTAAKAICGNCPVQAECLQYALRTKQVDGMWAGLTPTQRKGLRAKGSGPHTSKRTGGTPTSTKEPDL